MKLIIAEDDTDAETFEEIFWENFQGNETVVENPDLITFDYLDGAGTEE